MLTALTQRKDETGVSYEKISTRIEQKRGVYISVSKLQRIFTGQQEPTVHDYEMIAEAGLEMDLDKTYAKVGKQEVHDSEHVEFMGAKALLADFSAEKAQIRDEYEKRIAQSIQARMDTQAAFDNALQTIQTQYAKNAEYLTSLVKRAEAYNAQLTERAIKAEDAAEAANKRVAEYEKKCEQSEKRRLQVFWSMLALCGVLLGIIILSMVANVPALGWGNP